MRILFIILGALAAIIALTLSILPFGMLAFIPAIAALIFGLLAFTLSNREGKSKGIVNLILLLTVIALAITTYRSFTNENTIETDTEFIEKEKESEEKAMDELEDLEGLDDGSVD
jgi:carbon starvation protein CstA